MSRATMTKTTFGALMYSVFQPHVFSIISSIVIIIYFASMLKINVVNKEYESSWRLYFKSWFKFLRAWVNRIFKKNE